MTANIPSTTSIAGLRPPARLIEMDKLVVLVVFFVFVFVVVVAGRWTFRIGRKRRFYKQLALRYGGNVVNRVLCSPRMWFRYGSTMGYLKGARSRQHREQTILILTWPDKGLKFEITTPDRNFRAHRYSEQIDAKEQGFNRSFKIQTNNRAELERLLSHGVRWKIEQLMVQLGVESVLIKLANGKLRMVKPGRVQNFQQLDDLVRMGLELHDQMLLTKSEGIDFVDEAQAQILGDVKCPICSEEVMEEMVICVRCKTPHCKDCWQYNGHCATFACNETRFFYAGGGGSAVT